MGFWEEPQGAAVYKHALLDQYAPIFASKTGKYSPGHRVAIIDGYAGRGWYEDGSPGSPARMLATARALRGRRDVHCWFVEKDAAQFRTLNDALNAENVSDYVTALHGDVGERLGEILRASSDASMFAFIDPFGIGLPFGELTGELMGRTRWVRGRREGPPTEVLVNFVRPGIYRNAGFRTINSQDPIQLASARTKVAELDANLDGDWWHKLWLDHGHTPEFVDRVRDGYVERVLQAAGGGWQYLRVPVADTVGARPIYDLILFTQHEQGLWFFNEAASRARDVFERHCGADLILRPQLWDRSNDWVAQIKIRLRRLLAGQQRLRVGAHVHEIYGPLIGLARGDHVKRAIKEMDAAGELVANCRLATHLIELIPVVGAATA